MQYTINVQMRTLKYISEDFKMIQESLTHWNFPSLFIYLFFCSVMLKYFVIDNKIY